MNATHEVLNQSAPLVDVDLYRLNLPLPEALAWHHPGHDRARFDALGAEAGSAAMRRRGCVRPAASLRRRRRHPSPRGPVHPWKERPCKN